MDDFVAVLYELEADVARWLDGEVAVWTRDQAHQGHKAGFTAADRTGQGDAFAEIYAQLVGLGGVGKEVYQEATDQLVVGLADGEVGTELFASVGLEVED